jgi:DnaJ-class molecular chaperone
MGDYYQQLGVSRGATNDEIKAAFKKMALKYHPDRNPGDPKRAEEAFKKVHKAYEVLIDENKRRAYDQFGEEGVRRQEMGGGGGGGGGVPDDFAQDILRQFFGGGFHPAGGMGPGVHTFHFGGGPGMFFHAQQGGRPRREATQAREQQAPADGPMQLPTLGGKNFLWMMLIAYMFGGTQLVHLLLMIYLLFNFVLRRA